MDALDPPRRVRDRLRAVARWLDATPSEVAGVTLLLLGSVALTAVLWWQAQPRPATGHAAPSGAVPTVAQDPGLAPPAPTASPSAGPVTVHVAGAVDRPGVVELAPGARVADALDAAGGPTGGAEIARLNLARPLADGEQIHVPVAGEPAPSPAASASGSAGAAAEDGDERIDLNQAGPDELEELPGIGPTLAERIVEHREEHGPFGEVGQLRDVSGIGERTLQDLAEHVRP